MKKVFAILLVLSLAASLFACDMIDEDSLNALADAAEQIGEMTPEELSDAIEQILPEEASASLVNPLSEATAESILSDMGIDLTSLSSLENVQFYRIAGDPEIAEVRFTLDGDAYTYRVAMVADTADISGMYYEFTNVLTDKVDYCDATVRTTSAGQGVVEWFDVVPGAMYSLSMTEGASSEKLLATARKLFTPMQGDAEGDAALSYTAVLDAYSAALDAHKGPEEYMQAGLNYLVAECAETAGVGYQIIDLDGDGIDELLIGTITDDDFYGKLIYDLYTLDASGSVQKLFESGERDRHYYLGGNLFANVGSSGASESFETTEQLTGGALVNLNTVTAAENYVQADLTPFPQN